MRITSSSVGFLTVVVLAAGVVVVVIVMTMALVVVIVMILTWLFAIYDVSLGIRSPVSHFATTIGISLRVYTGGAHEARALIVIIQIDVYKA